MFFFNKSLKLKFKEFKEIPSSFIDKKIKSDMEKQKESRLVIAQVFLLFLGVVIFLRAFSFSYKINIPFTRFFSKKEVSVQKSLFSRRDIVDKNGQIIAATIPSLELFVDARNILFAERTADALVKIFPDLDKKDLLDKFSKKKRAFQYIKRKIPVDKKTDILKIGDPGLDFVETDVRSYPQGRMFVHLIGGVNVDKKGISGIERSLDSLIKSDNPNPVKLSVDTNVQLILRDELLKGMEKYQADTIAAVIMESATGKILGMVSLPDYNSEDIEKALKNKIYNNHVSYDTYEQGSVFKVFNTLLALENGVDLKKKWDTKPPFYVGGFKIKDDKYKGSLNLAEILAYSSNIGSAKIALSVGWRKQKELLERFKFNEKVDLEIFEKGNTQMPSKWYKSTIATVSYGYGVSITPLHLLLAFNAVVNNGCYVKPTVLENKNHFKLDNEFFEGLNKNVNYCEQIVDKKYSDLMKKMMRLVMTHGTGRLANSDKVKIAGKTGTAYMLEGRKYSNKKRTVFASFFPADKPKYTMLVLMNNPKINRKDIWCNDSSCNVVPVSKNIIERLVDILD